MFTAHSSRQPAAGGIIRADHGAPVTSWAYTRNVDKYRLRLSPETMRDWYDNAMIESFCGRMQIELWDRKKWTSCIELSRPMVSYIDALHNHKHRHSSLGTLIPTEYTNLHPHAPTNVSPPKKYGSRIILT